MAEGVNAVDGALELKFDDFERFVCEPDAQVVSEQGLCRDRFDYVAEVNVEQGWREAASLWYSPVDGKFIGQVIFPAYVVGSVREEALDPFDEGWMEVVFLQFAPFGSEA